jgi:hypothetical protein
MNMRKGERSQSYYEDLGDLESKFIPGSSYEETPLGYQAKEEEALANTDSNEENTASSDEGGTPGDDTPTDVSSEPEEISSPTPRNRKYADEDSTHPHWATHKKHVFVLSSAGKPIYSRYGDEQKLATFIASVNALISFVEDTDDSIRHVIAGDRTIVFIQRGPIYLVAAARTGEPVPHLARQLDYTHAQIISILTQSSVNKIFKARATFDLRNLLGGTDKILDCLLHVMDNDPSYMLNSVHCLRLPFAARSSLAVILHSVRPEDLLFSMLIAGHQLVHLIRPRKFALKPQDLHLVMNFVNSSSSFRSSESWTPICLPNFNDNGFLHAYVCYLTTELCLILISSKPESFYQLSECKNTIWREVTSNPEVIGSLNYALRNPNYSVGDIDIPSLSHFLYKSQSTSQFTAPRMDAPYSDKKERKRLLRLYQHVSHRVHTLGRPHKVYYLTTQAETIVAWVTSGFELYATFGPLEPKPNSIKACNQLLRWIKQEENNLFILNSPVW